MKISEEHSTSTARIKPNRKIYQCAPIQFEDLESIRELELEQRRIRAQECNSRGW